jgi:uncharacterized protein
VSKAKKPPSPDPAEFAVRITEAYTTGGKAITLGRGVLEGQALPDAVVQIPAAMTNRHGLIAGATGTGKTKTLQLLAEQLSAIGVSVVAADVKGDLSGLAKPGTPNDKITARSSELGVTWEPKAQPVSFWSLGGQGPGIPIRATISGFGPQLLAKVLDANDTQSGALALVFDYADRNGLPLLDLADLRAVLQHLTSDDGKADLKGIGGLSSATAGVLLREMLELDQQDGEALFGEPELDIDHLIATNPDGTGVINLLELAAVQDRPRLYSTFLMWLLAELFEQLPEVGDLDQPKLVFFFDEAHLLFTDASKDLRDQIAQTVRLIRSKGVGVFFITQLPDDVPDEVLAQLGNRIQHALRAFTPRDAKALRAAVTTYPNTDDYDLEEDLTQLGTGEAMVTILSERGAPTPVVWTRLIAPSSLMAAIDSAEIDAFAKAAPVWSTYADEIDRDSAHEMLARKMSVEPPPPSAPSGEAKGRGGDRPRSSSSGSGGSRKRKDDDGNAVSDYLKSREGRSMLNTVVRGVFGLLKKRR